MQLFVKVIPLRAGTADAAAEGELFPCPADVEPDTILSFLTQKFGEVVETAWTSTDRHDRVACGWIFAGAIEKPDGQELLCVPIVETADGSLESMFEVLADERLVVDELASSGQLDSHIVISLPHRDYRPTPADADDIIDDDVVLNTLIDAVDTRLDGDVPDTTPLANFITKGGGHRHGTGRPGTTEFPATWTDDQVLGNILSVARKPDRAVWQENNRWRMRGHVDGVEIIAIVKRDGEIITAWPLPGGRGVQQNPSWSMTASEARFTLSMKRLPGHFSDRLPADDLDALHMMAAAGEWEEEIDLLIADLTANQQSVTNRERTDLRRLLMQIGLPVHQLDKLTSSEP